MKLYLSRSFQLESPINPFQYQTVPKDLRKYMHIQNVRKHMDDIYIPKQTNEIKHNDRNPIAVCIVL